MMIRFDSIMALIWSSSTSFGRPERCSSLSEKSPERNLSNQFRHINMTKMLVFTLHLKVDTKLITLNEIARNLFVKQTKSDS